MARYPKILNFGEEGRRDGREERRGKEKGIGDGK